MSTSMRMRNSLQESYDHDCCYSYKHKDSEKSPDFNAAVQHMQTADTSKV